MIDGYHIDELGIIHETDNKIAATYNQQYIKNSYCTYDDKCKLISYLRLGHIIGSIGRVPNSILDVGYGSGDFLQACAQLIPKCYGNDITGYPIPQEATFIEDIYKDFFDVITFFDVLEHFEDISIINKLKCNYICISLPWCVYKDDEWFINWKHRRPGEHLHHFNEVSLVNFFKKYNYSLVNYTNIEDAVRQDKLLKPNILTAVFKNNG